MVSRTEWRWLACFALVNLLSLPHLLFAQSQAFGPRRRAVPSHGAASGAASANGAASAKGALEDSKPAPVEGSCGRLGTAIDWYPLEKARAISKESGRPLFVMHLSGNFEKEDFT